MTVQDHDPDGNRSEEIGTSREEPTEAAVGEPLTRVFENPFPDWDRYTIVDYLGEGAMGLVYRALDPSLRRHVAIKFIASDDPDQKNRFQREARAHAQIEHDHVCRVYEVGEVGGRAYIAMQLIDGRSLQEVASDLTLEQRVVVMEQVAEAVQAAHSMGVIHRDIKPGNIMVENRDGGGLHAYVLDFGIAREVGSPGMTLTGTVVGTPAYMAPEQVQGDPGLIDRRVDVYGIGATLYDLIAGEAPFSGSTRIETLVQVVSDQPRPLRELDGRVPVDLETIVSTCLEKDPQRRYASARALAEDLQNYLDGEPIAARPASRVYRVGKSMRKHRALTALERAVDLIPDLAAAHNNLGNAHKMQAVVEMDSGNDPRPSLERAATAYGRAIEFEPNLAYQYKNSATPGSYVPSTKPSSTVTPTRPCVRHAPSCAIA
jgi:serine/threonine protein kinase